ncbi:helix-turn-helix domain-containing protein [uncultured Roseobacter sp.]|uniref:helix-turn-helix domain-containing protein n=1 Tax=uncultured Roseobacter sp. TaxID=114847 RepID=UPI00260CC614|nr:helix-turn-helix domain-containing protein [uncultured Roseobacter sp.]
MNSFGARFGVLVKDRRGVEGLTQQALSVLAFGEEAKKARISELENGRIKNPQQRVIDALSVALNLSDDDIASCRKPRVPELPSGYPAEIGMTDELVEALSWRFGFENPKASSEQYQQFLSDKSEELTNLRSRIGTIGKTSKSIAKMMAAANHEIEQGHFEAADDILRDAEELQQKEHTLTQVRKQAEIRIVRAEGALLKGDDGLAYSHYKVAAEFFTPFDPIEGARHRRSHYTALYDHAMRFGGSGLIYATELAEINVSLYAALDQKP